MEERMNINERYKYLRIQTLLCTCVGASMERRWTTPFESLGQLWIGSVPSGFADIGRSLRWPSSANCERIVKLLTGITFREQAKGRRAEVFEPVYSILPWAQCV